MTTNKRPTETFLVTAPAQNALPTNDTALYKADGTTNLNNGQLGFVNVGLRGTGGYNKLYSTAVGDFNSGSTITITDFDDLTSATALNSVAVTQMRIAVGLSTTTTSTYPLYPRTVALSNPITAGQPLTITKQVYREPKHSAVVVGAPTANTNSITVSSNTEYGIQVMYRGRRVQEMASFQEASSLRASFVTPDFTTFNSGSMHTTAGSYAEKRVDYLLHNLAFNINKNSAMLPNFGTKFNGKHPVIAFLIDTKGTGDVVASGDGVRQITGANQIAAGQTFTAVKVGSTTYSITFTQAMVDTLQAVVGASGLNVATNAALVPVNLSTAGTIGATTDGEVDVMVLVGLDEVTAYVDYIPQVKTKLQVGLTSGFASTVQVAEFSKADEGQGLPRQLDLHWKATEGQRLYTTRHTEDPVINFASPIDLASTGYVVYNILHGNSEQVDIANVVYSPYNEIVCIPRYSSGTTTNALIALFDNAISGWVNSARGLVSQTGVIISLN